MRPSITGSYAAGPVGGTWDAGGLVGSADSSAVIVASYATGRVRSRRERADDARIGGLIGANRGRVVAAYATGEVTGSGDEIGGLVGSNYGGLIYNTYATGVVVGGGPFVGGLVGYGLAGAVHGSYWDVNTSGHPAGVYPGTLVFPASFYGEGRTTAALRAPAGYTGVFDAWNRWLIDEAPPDNLDVNDLWDFGTAVQYPALKVDVNGDGRATSEEFGSQRPTFRRFTDHPIRPGATPVKRIHLLELRERIDDLRSRVGLSPFVWTDPAITVDVTRVKRVHFTELRAALAQAYAALGRPQPHYADEEGTVIRALHLMDLRAAVVALE